VVCKGIRVPVSKLQPFAPYIYILTYKFVTETNKCRNCGGYRTGTDVPCRLCTAGVVRNVSVQPVITENLQGVGNRGRPRDRTPPSEPRRHEPSRTPFHLGASRVECVEDNVQKPLTVTVATPSSLVPAKLPVSHPLNL